MTGGVALDVVIAWVDGADSRWRQRRETWRRRCGGGDAPYADVEGRYRNNGELRFLLMSLRRFLPQARHIWLVTDNQSPDCLDGFPEVTLVDHRDFVPATFLPTFSSRAIEASLHRIPGLAEHFVYFNDDICLMRPADVDDFFDAGGSVVHVTDMPIPDDPADWHTSEHCGAAQAARWMRDHGLESSLHWLVAHGPRGIRKSLMRALEDAQPRLFAATRRERFRNCENQNVLVQLYPQWCLAQGLGEVRHGECSYLTSDDFQHRPLATQTQVHERIWQRQLSLCVNDTGDDGDISAGMAAYRRCMDGLFGTEGGQVPQPHAVALPGQ